MITIDITKKVPSIKGDLENGFVCLFHRTLRANAVARITPIDEQDAFELRGDKKRGNLSASQLPAKVVISGRKNTDNVWYLVARDGEICIVREAIYHVKVRVKFDTKDLSGKRQNRRMSPRGGIICTG